MYVIFRDWQSEDLRDTDKHQHLQQLVEHDYRPIVIEQKQDREQYDHHDSYDIPQHNEFELPIINNNKRQIKRIGNQIDEQMEKSEL